MDPISILVVDDDERVLRTFSRNLKVQGHTVFTAKGGAEAIARYRRETPAITLVDMRMPDVDGFEVLRTIRAQDPEAEVILTTGHGDKDMVIQALRAGASDFIPKPIDRVVLDAALGRAEERLRLKHELHAAETALQASEMRFRAAAEGSLDAFFILESVRDAEGEIVDFSFVYLNTRAEALLRRTKDQLVGAHLLDVMPDAQVRRFFEDYVRVVETGEPREGEYYIVSRYTGPGWYHQQVVPLADGVAISNRDITQRKRMEEELRQRVLDLQTVAEVGVAATTILDTDALLWMVVALTKSSFDLYHVQIYLLDATGEALELVAGSGEAGRRMMDEGWRISVTYEDSLVVQAYRTREGVVVNDVQETPNFLPNPALPATRSELAVPLVVGDSVLGVLDVQSDEVNHFNEASVHTQKILASQVAIALKNARLFASQQTSEVALREAHDALEQQVEMRTQELRQANAALRRRNRELALLNRAGHAFSSSLNLQEVLDSLLEEVRQLLGAMGSSVWLVDPETGELVCEQAVGPESGSVVGWRLDPGQGLAGWVVEHGESLVVDNAPQDPRHFAGVDTETALPLRSILSVPLSGRVETIGVIQMVDVEAGRFSEDALILLEPLAASAASAIENARLYAQAREQAGGCALPSDA
jgi:PAS domain S-box-containing protein